MEFKHEIENECAFHVKQNKGFCAPDNIVNKLKDISSNFKKMNNNSKTVLQVLKDKYDCKSETCVLNQQDVMKHINPDLIKDVLRKHFKPTGPKFTNEWLSNFNIDEVLDQIAKKYTHKHFLHIPFQMRDFEKTNSELALLDWQKEYENGYRTFGTVMNTDYSTGRGIHWFALFGDFSDDQKVFTIEYFNSSGEYPLPEVNVWMKKMKHKLNFPKEVKDVIATKIVNQNDSHSCGPYSLYYIISRLEGVPIEWFKTNRITDYKMRMFRQYLFREEE